MAAIHKEGSQMFSRKVTAAAFGAAILAVLATASMQAAVTAERTTLVKFSRTVALPGLELTAGTYIFELAEPGSNNNLVRVLSRDRRKVYTTQFTILVQRPKTVTDNHGITFHEAPAGQAPPIKAWYPIGHTVGHEFIYQR
jgi:hypothetical protein